MKVAVPSFPRGGSCFVHICPGMSVAKFQTLECQAATTAEGGSSTEQVCTTACLSNPATLPCHGTIPFSPSNHREALACVVPSLPQEIRCCRLGRRLSLLWVLYTLPCLGKDTSPFCPAHKAH